MLSFLDKYFDDGLEMWNSGLALNLLRSIPGRQARRCLAALDRFDRKARASIPNILVKRFKGAAMQIDPKLTRDEIKLLEQFDEARIQPLADETHLPGYRSPPELKTAIRKSFFGAATRVFGKSTKAPAGERQYYLRLAHGFAWCPVVVAGRPTAQVVYWGTIEGLPPTISGLSILSQLGVAGSTEWDLILNETQAMRAAAEAESMWKIEAERLGRLVL